MPQATSFYYFVGGDEKRLRHLESKRLGRLEVEHQFKLGRLHDRQVGRLRACENSSSIDAGLMVGIAQPCAVTDEATVSDELSFNVNGRNSIVRRQLYQFSTPIRHKGIGRH